MLDRRETLTNISKALRGQASALQALNLPSDEDIGHVDVAAGGNLDEQVAA